MYRGTLANRTSCLSLPRLIVVNINTVQRAWWRCSLSCINAYLAVDSGDYVNEYFTRSNCNVAEFFPEKSSWHWNKQICQWASVNRFEHSKNWWTGKTLPFAIHMYILAGSGSWRDRAPGGIGLLVRVIDVPFNEVVLQIQKNINLIK